MVKITEKNDGKIRVISLIGKIDTSASGDVEKSINALIDQGNKYLVMDFSNTEYISSSGLRVMLSSLKRLKKVQGDMKMACAKPMVKHVFEMAGFTQIFEFYDSEEAATSKLRCIAN
jgi:anti-sigma B factor antagonist